MTETVMDWDLTGYFPDFKGNEMNEFKTELENKISITYTMALNLKENSGDINLWEELLTEIEDISKKYSHIKSYVGCLASADANNQDYLKEEADLSLLGAEFQKIEVVVLSILEVVTMEIVREIMDLDSMNSASYYIQIRT